VASLGEAFGFAVQHFGQSNEKLGGPAAARGGGAEPVAGAQRRAGWPTTWRRAREVIDLSLLSQKQIVEDLQQLARRRLPAGSEA
jgi:hypothetical protein